MNVLETKLLNNRLRQLGDEISVLKRQKNSKSNKQEIARLRGIYNRIRSWMK